MMGISVLIIFYLAAYSYWSFKRPNYNHYEKTISELGETGSGLERKVGLSLFLPIGLGLAAIAWFAAPDQHVALLAAAMSLGYIGGAIFPIDEGAPISGSWKNGLHNLFGGIEYMGAIAALQLWQSELSFLSSFLQLSIIVFIASLYIPLVRQFRGLLQRMAEIGLFLILWFAINHV